VQVNQKVSLPLDALQKETDVPPSVVGQGTLLAVAVAVVAAKFSPVIVTRELNETDPPFAALVMAVIFGAPGGITVLGVTVRVTGIVALTNPSAARVKVALYVPGENW
jgi:hypothetical protein